MPDDTTHKLNPRKGFSSGVVSLGKDELSEEQRAAGQALADKTWQEGPLIIPAKLAQKADADDEAK